MKSSKKEPNSILNLLAYVLWSVWVARNDFAFKGRDLDPLFVSKRVVSLLIDYQDTTSTDPKIKSSVRCWSPPPQDFVKINMDAASFENHQWGLGVLCRDGKGKVLRAASKRIMVVNSTAVAECLAIRWALVLNVEWVFRRLLLEIDCISAVIEFRDPNPLSLLFEILWPASQTETARK